MKKPSVFQNKINKKINNNSSYAVTRSDEIILKEPKNINKKINDIFKSKNFVYKANVLITFNDRKENKIIVGINKNNLITIDNEIIPINEIVDIEI